MLEQSLIETNQTILITGPSGSGKSRMAKLIHERSLNSIHQFYQLNMTAIAYGTFESEMFGHIKGAFTGASADKKGFVASVGKGTLFLDEIGDLSLGMQAKLLMLLEEGIYYPVGSTLAHKSRARFILATNKDLSKMVAEGKFREDLFYRISTFELYQDALKDMPDKQDTIEREFITTKKRYKKEHLIMCDSVMNFFSMYDWPGNYREMKKTIEFMVICSKNVIELKDLPHYLQNRTKELDYDALTVKNDYHEAVAEFEKQFLYRALKAREFRINKTAREVGISKVTLLSKIKKYGIQKGYDPETIAKKVI